MKRIFHFLRYNYHENKLYKKLLEHHTKGLIQLLYAFDDNQIKLIAIVPLDTGAAAYSIKEQENHTAQFDSSMAAVAFWCPPSEWTVWDVNIYTFSSLEQVTRAKCRRCHFMSYRSNVYKLALDMVTHTNESKHA